MLDPTRAHEDPRDTAGGPPYERMKAMVARLRRECPWDRKQTLPDCRKFLVEEVYELVDAIDAREAPALVEELGDLAFVFTFTAQIASDEGLAKIDDAMEASIDKMVARHPHVYGDETAEHADAVIDVWTRAKQAEKRGKAEAEGRVHSAIEGVPRHLPALQRAYRVQEKAARVGFDWPDARGVREKVTEELGELDAAIASGDTAAISDELGDVLMALVNLGRRLGVNPEEALTAALRKFVRRFEAMERLLAEGGQTPLDASAEEMDAAWHRVKAAEATG